jgi:hypothetical protein
MPIRVLYVRSTHTYTAYMEKHTGAQKETHKPKAKTHGIVANFSITFYLSTFFASKLDLQLFRINLQLFLNQHQILSLNFFELNLN